MPHITLTTHDPICSFWCGFAAGIVFAVLLGIVLVAGDEGEKKK